MLIRVSEVKDISKVNRINYLFRTGQLTKYVDAKGYACFDQEEYLLCKKKKPGRKIK